MDGFTPYSVPYFPDGTSEDLLSTFDSTYVSGFGESLDKFERLLSNKLGSPNLLSVSNGSAALRLAFLTLGFKPGDTVIVPAWGFHVAANISYSMGANVRFLDVSEETWCSDLALLGRSQLNDKSIGGGFLVLIHTLGNCSNLDELSDNTLIRYSIIEDAAEALFSKYKDRHLGTLYDVGTFSFHAAKTIATGEGGLVHVKDNQLLDRARLYRSHGMNPGRPYFHQVAGDNLRMSNLLAALGIKQLENVDFIINRRKSIYTRYRNNLSTLAPKSFLKETDSEGFFPWGFGLRILESYGVSRRVVSERLLKFGIETRPGFSSAGSLPYERILGLNGEKAFPIAEMLSKEVLLLPHYPSLSDQKVDQICEIITSLVKA